MIKVPATDEGLKALEGLVADGISVNLTLLFSRQQTLKAYEAYVARHPCTLAAGGAWRIFMVGGQLFLFRVSTVPWMPCCPSICAVKRRLLWPKPLNLDWQLVF